MPTYVYECPECKTPTEIQTYLEERDETVVTCEHKDGKIYRKVRVIAPTSFILKGRGWAKDGYSK